MAPSSAPRIRWSRGPRRDPKSHAQRAHPYARLHRARGRTVRDVAHAGLSRAHPPGARICRRYGPWPAAWLNGCYGFVAESTGEFLLQEGFPFLCGQYWPPELDFFEHFSPEHTWFWRPNSMSLHSPNQV